MKKPRDNNWPVEMRVFLSLVLSQDGNLPSISGVDTHLAESVSTNPSEVSFPYLLYGVYDTKKNLTGSKLLSIANIPDGESNS